MPGIGALVDLGRLRMGVDEPLSIDPANNEVGLQGGMFAIEGNVH